MIIKFMTSMKDLFKTNWSQLGMDVAANRVHTTKLQIHCFFNPNEGVKM